MRNIKEIGEALKNKRLKKGLTFDDIYKKTRIYPGIIKSLEEGKIEESVSRIYAKGFLKKYIEFLGLNKDEILKDFDRAFPKKEENKIYAENLQDTKIEKPNLFNIILGIIAVLVVVIFTFVSVSKGVSKINSFFTAKTEKSALLALSKIKDKPQEVKTNIFVKKESYGIELILKNKAEVWMSVKTDDKIVFKGTLARSSTEKWNAGNSIELRVGKLEALDFTVNGKNLGVIGSGAENIYIDKTKIKVGDKVINL